MASFLVGAMPFVGHVSPLLPIVQELVARGHEVRFYTAPKFREKIEATGATYLPVRHGPGFDDDSFEQNFPERKKLSSVGSLKFDIKHCFVDSAVGQFHDWREILMEYPADVMFVDSTFVGASWLHELAKGPPWAAFNPLPVTLSSRDTPPFGLGLLPTNSAIGGARNWILRTVVEKLIFRDTVLYADRRRAEMGLNPKRQFIMDHTLSPYLYMQGTVPGFEYPRSDLSPQVHFVGPVLGLRTASYNPPDWWGDLDDERPVVHVTQGTLATDESQLIMPTIRALADQNVLVVVTTGGKPIEQFGISEIPANVRLETFIPHAHLLPHVDVMITNGGYNGVQMALSHGVPLIVAGTTEDKPEVAARVAWTGAGINLKTSKPSEVQISEAVREVLMYPQYRHNAEALAEEFEQFHAPTMAATLLEELVRTGQPVTRFPDQATPVDSAVPAG